jgi:tetratricopeptide (TPR) repeat protein
MAGLTEAMTPLERAKADIQQYSVDHEPTRWADGHRFLSQQCALKVIESSGPTRAADKAIEHIEEALKVITEKHDAESFAVAQFQLARMYPKRVAGNLTENLTKALSCAETALRVSKHPSCPPSFVGHLYAIIGSIYASEDFESSNSRAANQDLAIRHYLASLQRSSMHDNNESWADRQMKVGVIYYERTNGKRHSNAKVAIKHLVEALKVFTKSKHCDKWANIHEYLALSYAVLCSTADRAASLAKMSKEEFAEQKSALLEKCIASCTNALQVFTPTYGLTSW